MKKISILFILLWLVAIVGEIRCIYKAFTCNWEPVGKAEIIYTASACVGLGAFVGYIDIEDK
jgi:hypothetical protein